MKLKLSLYWKCQIIGWSLASLYWGFEGFMSGGFDLSFGILQFVSDVLLYVAITHLYRNFALKYNWPQLSIDALLQRIVPAALLLGIIYTVVTILKIYGLGYLFIPNFPKELTVFVRQAIHPIFIAGIRLMSIWLLAYHLYHYARREGELATKARDAKLRHLSAQLNPHFLFNSLNNVKGLILENPTSARRALDLLSDLLRNTLYGNPDLLVTVKEELSLVQDYLELEKLRMEERLALNLVRDVAADNIPILPLSIQTLVENAIKHGIDQLKDGGTINIEVSLAKNYVRISVENKGVLKSDVEGKGLGLRNLKERLMLRYDGKASFHLMQNNGIVAAVLLFPVV